MDKERFNQMLEHLKELGCDANIAVFAYSEEKKDMIILFPNGKGDSVMEMSSKLAKIFKTVLAASEQQKNKRTFEILRNAFAAATLPYINGLDESQLTALALFGI